MEKGCTAQSQSAGHRAPHFQEVLQQPLGVSGVLLLDDGLENAFELEELGVERAVEGERERDGGFLVLGWCILWHGGGLWKMERSIVTLSNARRDLIGEFG